MRVIPPKVVDRLLAFVKQLKWRPLRMIAGPIFTLRARVELSGVKLVVYVIVFCLHKFIPLDPGRGRGDALDGEEGRAALRGGG